MSKKAWWDRSKPTHKVPRDEGIPDTIRDWELDKGGWRYDEHNVGYKLDWNQLLEYEHTSRTIEDDNEFYEWFKKFRADKGISSRSYAGSLSDWKSDSWTDTKPKGKWLSSWWASDTYKGFAGSNDERTRLAVVLQAVRTTIRVVDNTIPPMTVKWADKEESYTDFQRKVIVINPKPVTEKKLEDGEAIDITTGFALHEASHSEFSREPYETIVKPTPLKPMQVAGMLLNFVEDIRIEARTADDFPGFAGYFDKSLAWAWGKSKAHLPAEWGPDLWSKLNAVLVIIRFPEGPKALTHPSFAAEIPWWTTWRDEYLSGAVDARTTIQRGIDHLREDPKTGEELDEMEKAEAAMEKAIGDLKKVLEKLMKEGMEKMAIKPCATDADHHELEMDDSGEVDRLVSEELKMEKPHIKMGSGRGNHGLYITHPQETAESKRAYIGKPKPVLHRLKAALVFRQELPRHVNRLLKRGGLDEEELWRWADQDYRVFNEEVIAARPQTQLSLLVDLSGSMWGTKLKVAQELAQLFIWALKDMEGVTTKVFGHTGDNSVGTGSVDIFRIWEPGEPLTRLGLINTIEHMNNYDGHAIAWTAKEILSRGQPDEQRVIIVLSDGYPSGIEYGSSAGIEHVREVVQWAARQGVEVIQIAIDPSLDTSRQARMFKRFFPYTDLNDVPKQLTKLLAQLT